MENTVDLSAGTLRYLDLGPSDAAETLVFVHGFAVDGRLWEGVALRAAARGLRCVVPTWPFGSHTIPMHPDADLAPPAAARLVGELLATLDLHDVTIVGNDSGGAVTQMLVTTDRSRIGRLVLTDCDSYDNFPPGVFKPLGRLAKVPGASLLLAQAMRFEPVLRSPLGFGSVNAHRQPTELLRSFVAPLIADPGVRRDAMKFFGGADTADTRAAAARFGELDLPTLLVWGADDTLFPLSDAERLRDALGAELVVVPDGKTLLPLDQPDAVADAITTFVAAHPVGAAR